MTYCDRPHNVFDWLDDVRDKPSMFVRDQSLTALEDLVWGYHACLEVHGIVEPVASMGRHFLYWLYCRTNWSCSAGWALAISQHYPQPDEAFATFFTFVDEYRKLRPAILCTVALGAEHNPTGKRCRYGVDGLMDKPDRVDVVCYLPEPLHFLRFHYGDQLKDGEILMTREGKYNTDLQYAKEWVRDELQVSFAAWKQIAETNQELAKFWDTHALTEFGTELEQVNEPVFQRGAEITVRLEAKQAQAVRKLVASRGVADSELIRQWVLERIRPA
jgi:hypothetical protein